MRLHFKRLTGESLHDLVFPNDFGHAEMPQLARVTLMGHFDSDGAAFWPKDDYGILGTRAVPEQVVFEDDHGNELFSYSLLDLIKDTGQDLLGRPNV